MVFYSAFFRILEGHRGKPEHGLLIWMTAELQVSPVGVEPLLDSPFHLVATRYVA
jgi:hypothetical protein